jgi:hypothetical protein
MTAAFVSFCQLFQSQLLAFELLPPYRGKSKKLRAKARQGVDERKSRKERISMPVSKERLPAAGRSRIVPSMATHGSGAERFRPDGMPVGRPFPKGTSGNPGGRERVLVDIHALAKQHTVAAIDRLVALMQQDDDRDVALSAATALLDRGWGRPAQAITANVNTSMVIGGIDAPPPIINETDAEWLERRRRELAALEPPKPQQEPAQLLVGANGDARAPSPLNDEAAIGNGAPPPSHASPSSAETRSSRDLTPDGAEWLRRQRQRLGVGNTSSPNPEWPGQR